MHARRRIHFTMKLKFTRCSSRRTRSLINQRISRADSSAYPSLSTYESDRKYTCTECLLAQVRPLLDEQWQNHVMEAGKDLQARFKSIKADDARRTR